MKFRYKAAVLIAGLAVGVTPALATAQGGAPTTSNGHGWGKACQGESKQHTKGTKGTPFSDCVKAFAKAANGSNKTARALCKTEFQFSHHMKGQKGTPFADCVHAVNTARKSGTTSTSTSTTTATTTGTTTT